MSEHSPGPWSFGSHCIEDVNGKRVVDIDGGPPMTVADARLIAAAPDLLHALKGAFGLVDKGEMWSGRVARVRAALAKAEGHEVIPFNSGQPDDAPPALLASHQDREG